MKRKGGDAFYKKVDGGTVILADAAAGVHFGALGPWGALGGAIFGSAISAASQYWDWD